MSVRLASIALASCFLGCSPAPVSVSQGDGGVDAASPRDDAASVRDAARPDAQAAIDAAIDTGATSADGGTVDLGTPCDAATYVGVCDASGRISYCDVTVHVLACPGTSTCMTHTSGVAACVHPGYGFCDPSTYAVRCGDDTHLVDCSWINATLGVEIPSACPGDTACRVGSAGAVCVAATATPCDTATFVEHCGTDHLVHDCPGGFERLTNGCGAGYVCATIGGARYDCVDPSLTPCDASFAESCEHAPDAAVVCSTSGFVVHERCGFTNPTCVSASSHAGCSYAGATSCTASSMLVCDTDTQYLDSCTSSGIPVRTRCIVGTGAFATCACRRLERHPMSFTIECAQVDGTPCATTDS